MENRSSQLNTIEEALEDLSNTYGVQKTKSIFKDLVDGLLADGENEKVILFLKDQSAITTNLEIKPELTKNAKLLTFLLIQKVNEIVHKVNKGTFKTYGAYCLLP